MALARVENESQRLVLDVTEAYLAVLEARQRSAAANSMRTLNEERLQVARVRLTAGAGILLEETQAEWDLAQAVQNEIDADAGVRLAGARLNSLIGRPVGAPLVLAELPETSPRFVIPAAQTEPPSPERLRELGMERPDLRALREDVRRANAEVDAARSASRPQLGLSGSFFKRIPETLMGAFSWGLGITVVHSLLDGGRARAGVESARAERTRRAAVLTEAERGMELEVETARVTLEAAEKKLAAEERRVAAATGAAQLAAQRQLAGAAAPIEVTEAQTVLTRAQTDALSARFDAARARARLAFAVGQAYPETVIASLEAGPDKG
jgi:outer membrane protein TolC